MELVRCRWETANRRPYLGNLKVMRMVLSALRGELERGGGALCAYVFLEDSVGFLAQGPPRGLKSCLSHAWAASNSVFEASDRKTLWGDRQLLAVPGESREEELSSLLRLPVEAGLVEDPLDYPWLGGMWLTEST